MVFEFVVLEMADLTATIMDLLPVIITIALIGMLVGMISKLKF